MNEYPIAITSLRATTWLFDLLLRAAWHPHATTPFKSHYRMKNSAKKS